MKKLNRLATLKDELSQANSTKEKIKILEKEPDVKNYSETLKSFFSSLNDEEKFLILSVIAIDQGPILFKNVDWKNPPHEPLRRLLCVLKELQDFYDVAGGIVGYHLIACRLIEEKDNLKSLSAVRYKHPPGIDVAKDSRALRKAIRQGILNMHVMAELYPVGGAGDRLNLHDERTGDALPVAVLPFTGRSLLEGLMRDLQAREYLHFKLTGKQVTIPVAMMTSHEKDNNHAICKLCEAHNWFGRPKDSFRFFLQPLVPMITTNGNWVSTGPLQLMLKPGGHGAIWKTAKDSGIFTWLEKSGRCCALIRQINNPIAGIDYGLTAFFGLGHLSNKTFGFASCQRLLNASEGMNVLIEKETNPGVDYCITNIEYTEFEKHGLKDIPAEKGSRYSLFPANTNILFVNLKAIEPIVSRNPIPGMLMNMKHSVVENGEEQASTEVSAGRVESMMQNIADDIIDHFDKKPSQITPEELSTFVMYNDRNKTIAVAKKALTNEEALLETPEGCFYELMQNHFELLQHHCNMKLPEWIDTKTYLSEGPPCIVLFHPALGPLFSIIAQKVRGGSLKKNSELQLEIAELEMEHVELDGCLHIIAEAVIGKTRNGVIHYSNDSGKCVLKNARVKNKGINRNAKNLYWKNQISRFECCRIVLEGNAEFVAENVTLEGNQDIRVPDQHRMKAFMKDGKVAFQVEKITSPTWFWEYSFDADNRIKIEKRIKY